MEQYGTTIEDKRTDNSTVKKKEEAWTQLNAEFNASAGIKDKRDVNNLKACWKT